MAARKKTWREKRDTGKAPHVTVLEKAFAGVPAGCRLLISSPQEIDRFLRAMPKGTRGTPAELREALARRHQADATCPVSTGIFLRIVAEAALEDLAAGVALEEISPFWRVVAADSPTAKKLSISAEELESLRRLAGE
jgi:hypothetical protein